MTDPGQLQDLDLRPGTYTVTFTLPGFSTLRREGIELTAGFTATVERRDEGRLARGDGHRHRREPVVDIQNVAPQNVLTREVLDALPTGKTSTASPR